MSRIPPIPGGTRGSGPAATDLPPEEPRYAGGVTNLMRRPVVVATVAVAIVLMGVVSVGTYHVLTHCGARVEFSPDPDDARMGITHESTCHAPLGNIGVDFDLSRPSQCTWSVFPPDQEEQWPSIDGNVSSVQGAPVTETFFAPAGHIHRTMHPPIAVQYFNVTCQPANDPGTSPQG